MKFDNEILFFLLILFTFDRVEFACIMNQEVLVFLVFFTHAHLLRYDAPIRNLHSGVYIYSFLIELGGDMTLC